MADPVGFSRFYPALPILNALSMVLCMLLTPGFWKTRIVALIAPVVWFFLGNMINFIVMVQWHGNTNDAPIWADFITAFWRMWFVGCFMSLACFAHFTWQRLQPLSTRQLYDTRRRNNLIHFFVTLISPLLWVPLFLFSCTNRYVIIEDLGPVPTARIDWPGFVLLRAPQILSHVTSILFNTLALTTYWRVKREDIESDLLRHYSSVRTRKLLILAASHLLIAAYGMLNPVRHWLKDERVAPKSFADNIASLQIVFISTRSILDERNDESFYDLASARIATPLMGFYLFAWFGCGEEARQAYREAVMKLFHLRGVAVEEHRSRVDSSPSPWSCFPLQRPKLQPDLAVTFPHTDPNALRITPYTSTASPENGLQPSASPVNNQPCSPVQNLIDIKRHARLPTRVPARHLSIHKPPLATSSPVNHISSASDVALRYLSHHNLPFVPLNIPATSLPDASGCIPPRVKGKNKTGQEENFTSIPHTHHSTDTGLPTPLLSGSRSAIAPPLFQTCPGSPRTPVLPYR